MSLGCHGVLQACIRPEISSSEALELVRQASKVSDWGGLVQKADWHGLGPLLYRALKQAGVSFPAEHRRILSAIVLRHRMIYQARAAVLFDLYRECRRRDLPLLALKGAALAHVLYPDPTLRPMRDIDVLIEPLRYAELSGVLKGMGFIATDLPEDDRYQGRHYPPWILSKGGFTLSIEVHHSLLPDAEGNPYYRFADLLGPPREFSPAEGVCALTLGHEDMLIHLCGNALRQGPDLSPYKWIQVADIINYAERFADQIDWAKIRGRTDMVSHSLALIHACIPLSESLLHQAGILAAARRKGVGLDYEGWPPQAFGGKRVLERIDLVKKTVFPSPWWLDLHYGYGAESSAVSLWSRHLRTLGKLIRKRLDERARSNRVKG